MRLKVEMATQEGELLMEAFPSSPAPPLAVCAGCSSARKGAGLPAFGGRLWPGGGAGCRRFLFSWGGPRGPVGALQRICCQGMEPCLNK
jgi:hypothetical protein